MKHIRLICLAMVMLLLLASCATPQDDDITTTTLPSQADQPNVPDDTTAGSDAPEYLYPDVKYNNETFRIFNGQQTYNMIMNVTAADVIGERVNDSICENIIFIEEQFQINIEETLSPFGSGMLTEVQNEMQSGDAYHDVVYLYSTLVGSMMSTGSLTNLYENESINIESPWWNQSLKNDASLFGSNVYYLISDAHLMPFEGTWCMYFNEEMMTDLGLELPYAAVRSNEWTMDKLYSYASQGASLNGDASFSWDPAGNSIYGLASFKNLMNAFVTGCDLMYVRKDASDVPYYSFPSESSLYEKLESIARITGESGTYVSANDRNASFHYIENIFTQGRALLIGAEIKAAANEMANTTFKFGMVPMPKYNSDQAEYKSNMLWNSLLMTIPIHVKDAERSGVIMDALSYLAMINTLPEYYDRVSYKGLADEDAIEMLGIINNSRYLNWGLTYGWLGSIEPTVNAQLNVGNASLASLVRASNKTVPTMIKRTLENLEK